MYLTMYFAMYPAQPRPPAPLRSVRPNPKPAGQAGAQGRRATPEVDMEWPADEPKADRSLDILVWSILLLSLASAILLRDPFLLSLALVLLLGLCALALLDAAMRRQAGRADRTLTRAIRAIHGDEHPLRVIDGLRGLELRGRQRLRLGIALRCLDEARRNRRLEWRLRREAVRWLQATKDELSKEVRT
jgi:hypothetical protein